jgi:hypothetical protein
LHKTRTSQRLSKIRQSVLEVALILTLPTGIPVFHGKQVAVVVAIRCTLSCWPGEALGGILHNGLYYDPQANPMAFSAQPWQNFAVPVPPNLMGNALLAVTHVALRRSQED